MMKKHLPDVAIETQSTQFPSLDWVGMESIELPILLKQDEGLFRIPAKVDAKVSLDKKSSRGIHMSRLYILSQDILSQSEISLSLLGQVVHEFIDTHKDLSSKAFVKVRFEAPLSRKALKSSNQAWRSYPVEISALHENGQTKFYLEVLVTYSSTCPASAALARQLIQENFHQQFDGQNLDFDTVHAWLGTAHGILATPHAQRSLARIKVEVNHKFQFTKLIDLIEESLQTPVQGAVKREDEQEFALRNGQNLMFCEDAARRVGSLLNQCEDILDYVAEFNHLESLHPHNAVSRITAKKVLKGFDFSI